MREPQNTLVPAGGTSIHPQKPTWNLKITLGKAQSSTNIYNSRLPKSGFSCSPPKKAQPPVFWPQSPRRLQDLRMQTAPESSTDGPINAGGEGFARGESFLLKSCKAFLLRRNTLFTHPVLRINLVLGILFLNLQVFPNTKVLGRMLGFSKKVTNFLHVPFLGRSIKINKAKAASSKQYCRSYRMSIWEISPNRGEESWKCCICCCPPPFWSPDAGTTNQYRHNLAVVGMWCSIDANKERNQMQEKLGS